MVARNLVKLNYEISWLNRPPKPFSSIFYPIIFEGSGNQYPPPIMTGSPLLCAEKNSAATPSTNNAVAMMLLFERSALPIVGARGWRWNKQRSSKINVMMELYFSSAQGSGLNGDQIIYSKYF